MDDARAVDVREHARGVGDVRSRRCDARDGTRDARERDEWRRRTRARTIEGVRGGGVRVFEELVVYVLVRVPGARERGV